MSQKPKRARNPQLSVSGSYTCAQIDAGQPGTAQTSMVKNFAVEMSERVTSEAMQVSGGAGYTTLRDAERCWPDARGTKIFEGTSEMQQRIISDVMLGKPTRPKQLGSNDGL